MHKKTVIDFKELEERLVFENPVLELKTRNLSEVKSILDEVASFQKQGYYVVGYLSYEAAPAFEEKFRVSDRQLAGEYLAYFTVHDRVERQPFPLSYDPVSMPEAWHDLDSQENYEAAIRHIQEQIRQGNTYQVNHTIRLKSQIADDSFAIYNRLMVEQNAGYNAYIAHDDVAILSASPELFFKKEGQELTTRPMKGTTSRGLTYQSDLEQQAWLAQDIKNRAENMMIVDLLRNDMGRVCQIGSVKVDQLCQVEQYSTVWQMTSTIKGILQTQSLTEIFEALYPCGSITGAPKIATMKVIDELESQARGVYCGTIGICLPNGSAIFNVPIRTMQVQGQTAYYGVGGGITWDSKWQGEFEETRQKSAVLYRQNPVFDLISTGKLVNGQLELRDLHLKRLKEAAAYFDYTFELDQFEAALDASIEALAQGTYRLRMTVSKSGQFGFEAQPLSQLPKSYTRLTLKERDLDLTAFVTFKTSRRDHIPDLDGDCLFYGADGRLQESRIANLVLDLDGELLTPAVEDGCLAGLYRQCLIDQGLVKEAHLYKEDLEKASRILLCNAVRGLYEVELERGEE
ncbi:aminodeoxychorismate synthase component I [Streptococcus loxodontisalivarius]|uniref:Para-aminobenzoate synthetase/4-amino-4-deoxychorismate lyase n=1 Tax=Streptococcus loxodontisalivarius TaxID=1349415 RepID=A0ABS2PTX3_9STRE|nr:aminodeoxychorismate synthase component I [Streptococcus loxodontisalivarius]MBM7642934.1 para-aminobenzoate synthetase/4-amino-4-deoxychorismate lyase [Streptococcus loxodontisalivarius]